MKAVLRWLVTAAMLGAGHVGAAHPGRAQEADLTGVGFVLGDAAAPVTVVEYADLACEACGQFARDSWPTIVRDYVEAGKVRWHLVLFELGFRNSEKGARAGQCAAGLGSFWVMHDALFRRQEEWVGERRAQDALRAIAADVGLDPEAFRSCFDEDHGEDRRKAANRAAQTDGVRGTPTFFIDGFRVQGALPLEAFEALLARPAGG